MQMTSKIIQVLEGLSLEVAANSLHQLYDFYSDLLNFLRYVF